MKNTFNMYPYYQYLSSIILYLIIVFCIDFNNKTYAQTFNDLINQYSGVNNQFLNFSQENSELKKEISEEDLETINKCIEQPNYIFCEKNKLFADYVNVVNQFDNIYSEIISNFDSEKKDTYNKTVSLVKSINQLQNSYYLKYYRPYQLFTIKIIESSLYVEEESYQSALFSLKETRYLIKNHYVDENSLSEIFSINIEEIEYGIKELEEMILVKQKEELWNRASKIYDQGVNAVYADKYKTAMNYFQQAYNLFTQLDDDDNAQIVQNQIQRLQSVCNYYGQAIYDETVYYLNEGSRAVQSGSQSGWEALFNMVGNIFNSSTRTNNPCND